MCFNKFDLLEKNYKFRNDQSKNIIEFVTQILNQDFVIENKAIYTCTKKCVIFKSKFLFYQALKMCN